MGTINCDPVTLTLEFDPFIKKTFNLANKFWTVSARASIFHMSIPCDKNFPWFYYFLIHIRAFKLHMSISCDKILLLVSKYLSLWPWASLELAIIGGICVSQTHLVLSILSKHLFVWNFFFQQKNHCTRLSNLCHGC